MANVFVTLAVFTLAALACAPTWASASIDKVLHDAQRDRDIPVRIYLPSAEQTCSGNGKCPVALLAGGYGGSHFEYSFIANALNAHGYLVVSLQHDLHGDPKLPFTGDLYNLRMPFWERGAENLVFAINDLKTDYSRFNWEHPVLIGHSNGGDISVWFARLYPSVPSAVITIDHRRVPLPRAFQPRMLSLRGIDHEADPGVLPDAEEQKQYGIQVAVIPGAQHNVMSDAGPQEIRRAMTRHILEFLQLPTPEDARRHAGTHDEM